MKRRDEVFEEATYDGKYCLYCSGQEVWLTTRGYVKCQWCRRSISLKKAQREIKIIDAFHYRVPISKLSRDLGVNYRTVARVYARLKYFIEEKPQDIPLWSPFGVWVKDDTNLYSYYPPGYLEMKYYGNEETIKYNFNV